MLITNYMLLIMFIINVISQLSYREIFRQVLLLAGVQVNVSIKLFDKSAFWNWLWILTIAWMSIENRALNIL